MVLLNKFLVRSRRALKLLVFNNNHSNRRQTEPSIIHEGRHLNSILKGNHVLKRATTALVSHNLTSTGIRLKPARGNHVSVKVLNLVNFVSHLRGLRTGLLLLHLNRVQHGLNKNVDDQHQRPTFANNRQRSRHRTNRNNRARFIPSLIRRLSSYPTSTRSSPMLAS